MGFLLVGVQVPPLAPRFLRGPGRPLFLLITLLLTMGACDGSERVVRRAITAAAENDREAYLACFTAESRAALRLLWRGRKAPLGSGSAKVVSVQPVVTYRPVKGAAGPVDSGLGLVAVQIQEGMNLVPVIVRGNAGVWRIDLFNTEALLTNPRVPF